MTRALRAWVVVVAIGLTACRTPAAPFVDDDAALAAAAAVAPAASAGCRPGATVALNGERRSLVVDGEQRGYLLDAPSGDAMLPRPLVLVFHGFRADAEGLRAGVGFAPLAAAGALVAVHPDGHDGVTLLGTTGRGWDMRPDETRDLTFVRALLDQLEQERCIDRRRIFATGFSNGGFVSNLLGCLLADRLAAVAPVAGALPLDDCRPAAPLPIMFFQGDSDRIVAPRLTTAARAWWRSANHCEATDTSRDGCLAARNCAADVVLCEGRQAHTWPTDATARIWRFFQMHPRT